MIPKKEESEEVGSLEGIPVVKSPKDLREELVKPWRNALIIKFLGTLVAFTLFH